MKAGILLLAVCMFVIPFVSADIEMTSMYNQNLIIKRPCFNNGTYCSSGAVCNISLVYPNGAPLITNALMTNNYSLHNISIPAPYINQFGEYKSVMVCNDGGLSGEDTWEILITGNGRSQNVFPTELTLLIIGFALIATGIINEKLKFFKTMGAMFVMVMGVWTLYPGYANFNYDTLPGMALGIISIGTGFWFMIQDALSYEEQAPRYDQEDDGRYHD